MNKETKRDAVNVALVVLGSNIERQQNLPAALERLRSHTAWLVTEVSSIYESAAVGGSGPQPVFWNAAVCLETHLTAAALRSELRRMESEMGRHRSADKFAPRPIDLDIALFNDCELNIEGSPIPDPDIERQAHVAAPLAEIAPNRVHPSNGLRLSEIASKLDRSHLFVIDAPNSPPR